MDGINASAELLWRGYKLEYGTVGLYGAMNRVFVGFALVGPLFLFIDAPFGRFVPKRLTINGAIGWLVMELVSPLTFLVALSVPLTGRPVPFSPSSLATGLSLAPAAIARAFRQLPLARKLLAAAFLVHYLNRSVVSTLRNPSKARMHITVFLAALVFNTHNGYLLGLWVGGGDTFADLSRTSGLAQGQLPLFVAGMAMWAVGLAGNIISDEILYGIKRDKERELAGRPKSAGPLSAKERYGVPHGFLYSWFGGITQPSYLTEWFEWAGWMLAASALAPASFPPPPPAGRLNLAAMLKGGVSKMAVSSALRAIPPGLKPPRHLILQPPTLFLVNEIAVMTPRAVRAHRWSRKTFGESYPASRKAVIPYLL